MFKSELRTDLHEINSSGGFQLNSAIKLAFQRYLTIPSAQRSILPNWVASYSAIWEMQDTFGQAVTLIHSAALLLQRDFTHLKRGRKTLGTLTHTHSATPNPTTDVPRHEVVVPPRCMFTDGRPNTVCNFGASTEP